MATSTSDSKPNLGLANSLSNVFKLADVNGLKWVRYVGPNSSTLEAPKDDPVLISYARLLNQGYACSWRRLNPCTDGFSGEAKDLWVFYFTDLPNITDTLSEELKEDRTGSWEEGMTSESSTMLYRALHNIIERSLLSENFLPLGKWFVQPDASVTTDGSSRGCFLCSFSFFVHAHLYICASVDMRVGPSLQTLLNSHINQALASSTGLQVILSPSGLNAVMTGHSYKTTDCGISDILEEWKLFYPRRFDLDVSPSLPAAIEVVTGGVRMRYPSQFVFVYHGEESSGPQPCTLENTHMEEFMQETWSTANCVDSLQQQKDSTTCRCNETRSNLRRTSAQLDLPLRMSNPRQSSGGRYEPYSTRNTRAKELATPGSINLMNQPALMANKLSRQRALPKYAAPLSSPGLMPSSSPTIHGKMPASSISSSLPLPSINLSSGPTATSSGVPVSISVCPKPYDQSKVPPSYLKGSSPFTYTLSNSSFTFVTPSSSTVQSTLPLAPPSYHHHINQYQQPTDRWWDSLELPESMDSLGSLQLPRQEICGRPIRNSSVSQMSPGITTPTSGKRNSSPKGSRTNRNSFDITTPGIKPSAMSPAGNNPFPYSATMKRRPSVSKSNGGPRSKSRGGKKGGGGEVGYPGSYMGMDDGFEGIGSPMSDIGGDHSQQMNGINGEGDELFPSKTHGIDVFSDKAVKIEAISLDQIFASDEEDDAQEGMDVPHSPFTNPGSVHQGGTDDKMDIMNIKPTKLSASEPIELSLIYPTPPSVENNEGDKYDEIKMSVGEGNEYMVPNLMWEMGLDEDLGPVPPDFRPLSDVLCFSSHFQWPQKLTYHKSPSKPLPSSSTSSSSHKKNSFTAQSFNSEPEQFIFPPPASLSSSRAGAGAGLPPAREGLTLPLSKHTRFSPHITPRSIVASSLGSSPAYPYPRAPGRLPPPGIPRHLPSSSTSALTPLESPTVTPTPLSATTNRLMPVLPEANGLYVNYSLLDSALGSNLSETTQVSNGPLLSTIQNFMKFSSRRMKLDSVADPMEGSSTTNLLSYQDEKPMMTFGIADYPSLGFKEELAGVGGLESSDMCNTLYGCLSKFASVLSTSSRAKPAADPEAAVRDFPMEKFLELLQDYCIHLCLTCRYENSSGLDGNSASLQERHHLLVRPQDRYDGSWERDLGCLYYSHSVVSAILSAKQLVTGSGLKGGGGTPHMTKPPSLVTLSKEDNSGAWIKDLLTLPTKLMTKRLKVLKSVLQNSFHQAPCLKFTTKGPLTLKDLQQLTPSMTALGDECQPLPIRPVVVGYDHEWLSVSPLSISSWDKLLFEPFSMRKGVAYIVVVPTSISSTSNLSMPLKKYFRELSITFKNCHLGQHVPLEKGVGEEGIMYMSDPPTAVESPPQPSPAAEPSSGDQQQQQQQATAASTDDPNTSKRHGAPAGVEDFKDFCKKILGTYLSSLPKDGEEILSDYAAPNVVDRNVPASSQLSPSTPPLSIVLYVLCNNLLHTTNASSYGSGGGVTSPPFASTEGSSPVTANSSDNLECFKIMRAFSDLLKGEDLPLFIRERIVLQLLDPKELLGPSSGHGGQLRSLAFSVYSRCHPRAEITIEGARSLTTFGPIADRRQHSQIYPYPQINAPPFILSSEPPLSCIGPVIGTQTHHILLDPDQPVLFCGYCVSPDHRWMLVVCCDRQGEMVDTSIIGIPYTGGYDIDNSRFMALQKLWAYLISIVSGSLHCWSIVITRFGKPSTSEISNWPCLFPDDGLLTANQVLRGDCGACTHTSSRPHISNVIILSIQPERNIQLFPNNDSLPPVSHALVLPQDPNSAPPPGTTPSVLPDTSQDDALGTFFEMTPGAGVGMEDGAMGLDFDLSGINIHEELKKSQMDYTPAQEDTSPKATGYLISTSPPGDLPAEFWGHDRPQSICSMFKVLLHCHRSEKAIPDSPQETLGSTLLCFDALSWLTVDHSTRERRTCLPLHLYVLSKLYHLFTVLDQTKS